VFQTKVPGPKNSQTSVTFLNFWKKAQKGHIALKTYL
jgi:hypothetical protein